MTVPTGRQIRSGKVVLLRSMAGKLFGYLRRNGPVATQAYLRDKLFPPRAPDYRAWIAAYDTFGPNDRAAIRAHIARFRSPPLISVLMPVHNTEERYLREAIDSVRDQLYPYWELCIADDASTELHVRPILEGYAAADPRIRLVFRPAGGHISAASNSALELATGAFVALLDHDDLLPEHALYLLANEIESHPAVDLIYSDEDKIDLAGNRYDPYFKPEWDPELIRGQNLFSHLGVYRRALVLSVGGFRTGMEGSQDLDLLLRCAEHSAPDRIRHIPHVLYHWRAVPGSTALRAGEKPYAALRARQALRDHLARTGISGEVTASPNGGFHRVVYGLPDPAPLLSCIIPLTGEGAHLSRCARTVLTESRYPLIELLIVVTAADEARVQEKLGHLVHDGRLRLLLAPEAGSNRSAMLNAAARESRGTVFLFLGSDVEPSGAIWAKELVAQASRPHVGAAGGMLYGRDGRVRHGGYVIGLRGVAGHAHAGRARGSGGYRGRAELAQAYSAVSAECLAIRAEIFHLAGGFDAENLPDAFADVDLCLRLRERGFATIWSPHAQFLQHGPAETENGETVDRAAALMRERWRTDAFEDPHYSPNLSLDGFDFTPAVPPRTGKPWRTLRDAGSTQ